jgi:hypothetical protein
MVLEMLAHVVLKTGAERLHLVEPAGTTFVLAVIEIHEHITCGTEPANCHDRPPDGRFFSEEAFCARVFAKFLTDSGKFRQKRAALPHRPISVVSRLPFARSAKKGRANSDSV